ncbi:MAG: hypothetical protein ACXAC0_09635 [Candidatus Thorarchaeota archaeon]
MDEFPLGIVLEYEKHYTHMNGPIDDAYTVRYEVTDRVEGYNDRYVVVRTTNGDDGPTVDTFYEDYPNGNLTAHGTAPLWIHLTSWNGSETVTLGWRVYNITSYSSGGCGLHHLVGNDEDTIVYESHGILATGYFFHFDIDSPFSTNSLSTKLESSNLVVPANPASYGWILTAVFLPAIAIEVVIIGILIRKRRIRTSVEEDV